MKLPGKRSALAAALGVAALGWSTAQAQVPGRGAALFAQKCAACHDSAGWGTRALARRVSQGQAELAFRKGLTADYVRYVVRHGVGSMPPFTPTDLSDAELRELGAWLQRGR